MNRAIFLDRDNTIVKSAADSSDLQQISLIRGAAHAIASLRQLGFRIVVIANEGAVARGVCSEADVDAVHQHIAQMAHEAAGAIIDRFYFCPYHPNGTVEAYRRDHPWRKPSPGMILQAARDLDVNLAESWMVGDSERDIEAGQAAGCRTILVGDHAHDHESSKAHYKVETLAEAAAVIAQYKTRSAAPASAHIVTKRVHTATTAVTPVPTGATVSKEGGAEEDIASSTPDLTSEDTDKQSTETISTTIQDDVTEQNFVQDDVPDEPAHVVSQEDTNPEFVEENSTVHDDIRKTIDQHTEEREEINHEISDHGKGLKRDGIPEPPTAESTETITNSEELSSDDSVRELRPLHMPITAVQWEGESTTQTEKQTNRLLMDVLSEIRSWRTSAREFTPVRLFAFVAMALILLGALASAIYIEGDRGLAWIGVALVAQLTVIGLLLLLPNG